MIQNSVVRSLTTLAGAPFTATAKSLPIFAQQLISVRPAADESSIWYQIC
jgi:hypothetical protein